MKYDNGKIYATFFLLWAVLQALTVAFRPYIPFDETRYLSVAWEMWQRHNFLIPYLNAAPYPDKPPVLFWMIHLGWRLFGVNAWWPHLVGPLFGLGSLFLTIRLAGLLWPDNPRARWAAPAILLSSILWTVFNTVLMFDMLIAFFVLCAITSLIEAGRGHQRYWLLYAAAVVLGLLSKGPVIFLPVLGVGLTAPVWTSRKAISWPAWYVTLALTTATGISAAALWLVAAHLRGHEEFVREILVGQILERATSTYDHPGPWWYYIPIVPAILFPWSVYPPLWQKLRAARTWRADPGLRLCAVWFCLPLAAFFLIHEKQAHYVLPLFPAVALAAGHLLTVTDSAPRRSALWPAAGVLMFLAAALTAAPLGLPPPLLGKPVFQDDFPPAWIYALTGLAVLLVAAVVVRMKTRTPLQQIFAQGLMTFAFVCVSLISLTPMVRAAVNVVPLSRLIRTARSQGRSALYKGKYHGEFNFTCRLETPLPFIRNRGVREWMLQNPDGLLIERVKKYPERADEALLIRPYLQRYVVVWPVGAYPLPTEGGQL